MTSPARPNTDTLTETIQAVLDTLGGTVGQGMAVAALSELSALAKRTEEAEARAVELETEDVAHRLGIRDTELEDLRDRAVAAEALVAEQQKALREIAETAGWYSRNGNRLPLEVDHALCVEVLSVAETALAAVSDRTEETA